MAADEMQPEVETQQVVRWVAGPTTQLTAPAIPAPTEVPFRPKLRGSVPILTVLDDGSSELGEDFRIRRDTFSIGRTEGDLTIPNDTTMSSLHAEIQRVNSSGAEAWRLVDRNAQNCTFVRVNAAPIRPDTILVLGSRRYRLHDSGLQPPPAARADSTHVLAKAPPPQDGTASLVEVCEGDGGLRFPLLTNLVLVGRSAVPNGIAIDDPLLASHHATLSRSPKDGWRIVSEKTMNGVWVNIRSIKLTRHCLFRCGEQVFRFVLP
jgi:pSer/pThr/pTyr-binding forkhead associated (FHA) protein